MYKIHLFIFILPTYLVFYMQAIATHSVNYIGFSIVSFTSSKNFTGEPCLCSMLLNVVKFCVHINKL